MFGFVASTTSTTPLRSTRAAARRSAGARARRRRAARASRRARGRARGTRASARPRRGRPAARRRRRASGRGAVGADPAELLLGEVPALAAEADALLDVDDRGGERERLVLRHPQHVEREPLRRALAHAGQPGQLGDEVLDGGAEHPAIVTFGQVVRQAAGRRRCTWGTAPCRGTPDSRAARAAQQVSARVARCGRAGARVRRAGRRCGRPSTCARMALGWT